MSCSSESNCSRCDQNPPGECSECFEGSIIFKKKCYAPIELKTTSTWFEKEPFTLCASFKVDLTPSITSIPLKNFEIKALDDDNTTEHKLTLSSISYRESNKTLVFTLIPPVESLIRASGVIALVDYPISIFNQSDKEYHQLFNTKQLTVFPIKYLTGSEAALASTSQTASSVFSVLSIFISIVSIKYTMQMNKIYQMFEYLLFLNIIHPKPLQAFLSAFQQGTIFDFLPNMFLELPDDHCLELGERFKETGMECQMFKNIGSMLAVLCIVISLRAILEAVALCVKGVERAKKEKTKYLKFRKFLKDYVGIRTLFFVISGTHIDIYFSTFLHVKYYKFGSGIADFNLLFSMAFVFVIFAFVAHLFFRNQSVVQYKLTRDQELEKSTYSYMFLAQGVSMKNHFSQFYNIYHIVKDPIIAGCVIWLYDLPRIQSLFTFLVMAFMSVQMIRFRPLTNKVESVTTTITTVSFAIVNFLFFLYSLIKLESNSKVGNIIFGFGSIAGLVVIIICNFIPGFSEGILKIKRFLTCKKKSLTQVDDKKRLLRKPNQYENKTAQMSRDESVNRDLKENNDSGVEVESEEKSEQRPQSPHPLDPGVPPPHDPNEGSANDQYKKNQFWQQLKRRHRKKRAHRRKRMSNQLPNKKGQIMKSGGSKKQGITDRNSNQNNIKWLKNQVDIYTKREESQEISRRQMEAKRIRDYNQKLKNGFIVDKRQPNSMNESNKLNFIQD